jgi:hypothetical protein
MIIKHKTLTDVKKQLKEWGIKLNDSDYETMTIHQINALYKKAWFYDVVHTHLKKFVNSL